MWMCIGFHQCLHSEVHGGDKNWNTRVTLGQEDLKLISCDTLGLLFLIPEKVQSFHVCGSYSDIMLPESWKQSC